MNNHCALALGLLAVGLMLPSQGAFEPWASNADPTGVPKRHVQEVTTSPFTYHLTLGGTMDGARCTTLPGVWEPYEQTWESSRSIRLENVGPAKVINPWLKTGPIDFFSQQTIANSVVEGLTTDREKALALFYFHITHRYHKGNGDNGAQGDVSQAINVFSFNTCGNSTLCLADLLDKVGLRDCLFSHCPGHVVPQVFFDGKYHTLDGDMATFMLLRDNHTLANELDLVRDYDLIKRVHQYGIMSPMNSVKNNEDYAQYYTWEGETTQKLKGRTGDAREYWLKCALTGNASLGGVKIQNDLQMASMARPWLGPSRAWAGAWPPSSLTEAASTSSATTTGWRISNATTWPRKSGSGPARSARRGGAAMGPRRPLMMMRFSARPTWGTTIAWASTANSSFAPRAVK